VTDDPLVSTTTRVTTVCAVAGLTAWYLVGEFAPNDVLEAVVLLGVASSCRSRSTRRGGDGTDRGRQDGIPPASRRAAMSSSL
jgi:hypothetical protein